ncbi:kinetochore protein NDC80 [Pancytospora philotis]|nr:kinetochore protein NDC80 [Pancytospora philotis]
MLKRFTITPQPRKSIKVQPSAVKPAAFPRMSIAPIDAKPARNVRDKAYKQACAETVASFLAQNNYDAAVTTKTLANPSNKEFQSIFKFIYSFIDPTPFAKFEDDVMGILKILKYPYSSEVTRSQLSTVTPHAWPVLLSMMSWLVELVNRSYRGDELAMTLETEFYEFVCEGYARFMEGNEDDADIEEAFVARMTGLHAKENDEIENLRQEVRTMEDEYENIKSKFTDLARLAAKKKKANEDLNALIAHERQLDGKKGKYIAAIEKIVEEITLIDADVEDLIRVKNELEEQISHQKINSEDIKGMNVEKVGLLKELERLKPDREALMRTLKNLECSILEKLDENENVFIEINNMLKTLPVSGALSETKTLDASILSALESELSARRESLVNYELNQAALEERVSEKCAAHADLESVYSSTTAKLQTIGAIYVEKKEISDQSITTNRSEMDRLDNDLLKLKLENDSAFLKSERDHSEAKIKLDLLVSGVSRDREEIAKAVWDLANAADLNFKALDSLSRDVTKLLNK